MKKKHRSLYLLIFIALLGVLWGMPLACAQEQKETRSVSVEKMQEAREHYAAGQKFIREGNYAAADKEFKTAQEILIASPAAVKKIIKSSDAGKASFAKIKEAPKLSLPKDKVSYYLSEIKLKPKNPDLYYNLAVEYLQRNQFEQAEEELKRVLQLNNRDKEACYNLAVLYEAYFNNKKQAIYYYTRYIKLDPQGEDVWRVKNWLKDAKKRKWVENE